MCMQLETDAETICRVLKETEILGGNPHLVNLIDRLKTVYQVPATNTEIKHWHLPTLERHSVL